MALALADEELREIYACRTCDCRTYPVCHVDGAPCDECFCVRHFHHRTPDTPALFRACELKEAFDDAAPLTASYVRVVRTAPNGDCLYECFSRALAGPFGGSGVRCVARPSIAALRRMVASRQTDATFGAYTALRDQPEYRAALRHVRTLRQLRDAIQRPGTECTAPTECVWGDENALNAFANAWRVRVCVYNEKGRRVENLVPPLGYTYTLVLRLDQGSAHYDLCTFNEHTLLCPNEVQWIEARIGADY